MLNLPPAVKSDKAKKANGWSVLPGCKALGRTMVNCNWIMKAWSCDQGRGRGCPFELDASDGSGPEGMGFDGESLKDELALSLLVLRRTK